MMKRLLAFILFFQAAGYLAAQDMPPLPPLANQPNAPADSSGGTASPALPPLPNQTAGTPNNAAPATPPLPDQQAAPAGNAAPANPPLPNDQAQPAPAPPSAESTQTPSPEGTPIPKHIKEVKPWERTKQRPNVIFGGWIAAKGGNESSRMAWASQEVLNALVFKKYKVLKEEGKYDGEEGAGGNQWRNFTLSVPKSKLTVEVYLKTAGKKVWMRVGPSEPPAFSVNSIAQVKKVRETNFKALHLIQKKIGRRLSPHRIVKSWEAPYNFSKEAVAE